MPDTNNTPYTLIDLDGLSEYTNYVERKTLSMTKAQYDALTPTQKSDGRSRFITDEGIIYKNNVAYGEQAPVDSALSEVSENAVQNKIITNVLLGIQDITYTLTQDPTDGHILIFTPSSGTATRLTIPDSDHTYSALSEFTNDTGFITKAANDLTNYYTTSNTYSKTEVNQMISAIPKFKIEVVPSLLIPDPSPTTIYLLLNSTAQTQNLYTEYIYIIPEEGTPYFEKLGEQTVDLSGYYTSNEVDGLLDDKVNTSDIGTAAAKNVDSSIADQSSSTNLPTSAAVASFVEGKGYVTTDTNTTYDLSVGSGSDADKIVLTPSEGNPEKITVPYATNAGTVNNHTVAENVPSGAVFTDTLPTIENASGTSVTQRDTLQFTGGVTVTDDSTNGKTIISIEGGGHEIENSSGVALPQEDTLQFAGYLRATDDSTNGKTVVTDAPEEVTWAVWQTMTTEQKQGHHWIITDAPGADGKIDLDLMEKLWENPDPTSSFAAQDVENLSNLSTYDAVVVEGLTQSDRETISCVILKPSTKGLLNYTLGSSNANSGAVTYYRQLQIDYSNNSIHFNDAAYGYTGQSVTNLNSVCIPYKIYGIKLHHEISVSCTVTSAPNHKLAVPTTAWISNTGSDATDFPYVANIASTEFSNSYVPSEVLLLGANASAYPTSAEETAIGLVDKYIEFSSTGVRLRATGEPQSALTLVVAGAVAGDASQSGVNQFTISASSWEANVGTDASEFPYVYNIANAGYSDGFIANEILLLGADITDYMTAAEITAKDLVDSQILINSTGIRLRATDEPQSDLTLVIRG